MRVVHITSAKREVPYDRDPGHRLKALEEQGF